MESIEKLTKEELKSLLKYVIVTETNCETCPAGMYCDEIEAYSCIEAYVSWWIQLGNVQE